MDSLHEEKSDTMAHMKISPRNMLFRKQGKSNIIYKDINSRRRRQYMKEVYITMLEMKWRYLFLILFAGFFVSTLLFSIIYYVMSYVHGDFEDSGSDPNFVACIVGAKTFWDSFLFSMETQSTIGYGALYPHTSCGPTIPVVFLQMTVGFLLETTLLGFVFMKMARPTYRRHTLVFSDRACICVEDQHLTLQIRIGDIRNTPLLEARVHGILVKRYETAERVVYPLFQYAMEFKAHRMNDQLFLFYPMVLSHRICPESPLYDTSAQDLVRDPFELLVILEGTIESTGEMVQAKTSIDSTEISWGFRFAPLEEYDVATGRWCINFHKFNEMIATEIPKSSARIREEKLLETVKPEPTENRLQLSTPL